MEFKYFDAAESQQFSFFQVPKLLFTEDIFKELSSDAKILYGIMLDRMFLSLKNGWVDDEGHVYIIYTIEETEKSFNCSKTKAIQIINELNNIGLIEKNRLGQGKPTVIYVKNFASCEELKQQKFRETMESKDQTSRSPENGLPEVQKLDPNNTNNKDTDIKDTEYAKYICEYC